MPVAHFAIKIDVGESVVNPRLYLESNVVKSLALLEVIAQERVRSFLFSSSAAVYGESAQALGEEAALAPINPYGMTKVAIEYALAAYGRAYGIRWRRFAISMHVVPTRTEHFASHTTPKRI